MAGVKPPQPQAPSLWQSRISIAAVLLFVPHVHSLVADVTADVCEREYQEKVDLWQSMSGATTEYVPMGHQPDWYWEEIMKRRGIDPASKPNSGYEDFWLDQLVGQAQIQAAGCSVHGGRYWEIIVDFRRLFDLMVRGTRFTLLRLLSLRLAQTESHFQTHEDLPGMLRLSVCMPFSCDEQMLTATIFPYYFAPWFMGPKAASKLGNASFRDVVQVNELQDWTSFNIDFVIGGTDSCGTSSLHKNLEQHPEVVFSTVSEDFFFNADLAHRLLPLKSQVDKYNAQLESFEEEKLRTFGFKPRLVGLCNPTIFANGLARRKLAAMPELKMILILCDPLGRLEKLFMEYHYCFDDLADATRRGLASRVRDETSACFNSANALAAERHGRLKNFWRKHAVAEHMLAVMNLFSGRTVFVHQEQLRENPDSVFVAIAKFLGVKYSFRGHTSFPRYNSIGGHRTDLCHNSTLVRELRRHLEPEYLMQEEIMREAKESIPASLRLRRTRCDDLSKSKVTYCPSRAACT